MTSTVLTSETFILQADLIQLILMAASSRLPEKMNASSLGFAVTQDYLT